LPPHGGHWPEGEAGRLQLPDNGDTVSCDDAATAGDKPEL